MYNVQVVDGQHPHRVDRRVDVATVGVIEVYEGCVKHWVAARDRMGDLTGILGRLVDHRPVDAFEKSDLGRVECLLINSRMDAGLET